MLHETHESLLEPHPHLKEHLEPHGTVLSFRRGNLIYTPGHPAQTLYVLLAGQVSLQLISSGGRVLTLQVIEPGQVFGHSMLAGSQHYDTFAEVLKSAHSIAISRDQMLHAMGALPSLGMLLLEELGKYRLAVSRRLDEVAFKSVPARLASVLLDMAGPSEHEDQSRLPRRTHQQLAEMINAYRETVTKVINQFRAANLLDIDQSGITLLNPSRLRELAQG
jgi:CRP-like cAMP-binding protein